VVQLQPFAERLGEYREASVEAGQLEPLQALAPDRKTLEKGAPAR
jgi:hypothetical protein